MELEEKQYSVSKVLKSFEKIAKDKIDDKKIDVILNVDNNIPAKLYGDSAKISQVILGLIDNACKSTEKGSITIDATCEKKSNNAKLIISIKDTGIGISKDKLENLFDSKLDNEEDYVSGMGLTIISKLIDLLTLSSFNSYSTLFIKSKLIETL